MPHRTVAARATLRLIRCALLPAALCALACDGVGSDSAGKAAYAAERKACVDKINAFRATENLPALAQWTEAETCADAQAQSDSKSGTAHGAFGDCKEWAQDECPGWSSVQSTIDGCLQSMWDERLNPGGQQGHYKNMSNKSYTMVACGFYETSSGKVWALQDFK